MSSSLVAHERLMNRSGTIQPRVGEGVGGGGRGGVGTLQDQSFNLAVGGMRGSKFGLGAAR